MTLRMLSLSFVLFCASCASSPAPISTKTKTKAEPSISSITQAPPKDGPKFFTPVPKDWDYALLDRAIYNQKDKRWAKDTLGNTKDSMAAYGCLVTATAMALTNLGFQTNPKDFNARMSQVGGFNARGWMVWSGIEKVTDGKATFKFYDTVSDEIIEGCLADGFYPLARFILPNGRDHWSMIVGKSDKGFHMRDPLRVSEHPLIFPRGSDAFKSVRCVGMAG